MKTKKLVALLLAVVMVLGLGTTAFASSNEKVLKTTTFLRLHLTEVLSVNLPAVKEAVGCTQRAIAGLM